MGTENHLVFRVPLEVESGFSDAQPCVNLRENCLSFQNLVECSLFTIALFGFFFFLLAFIHHSAEFQAITMLLCRSPQTFFHIGPSGLRSRQVYQGWAKPTRTYVVSRKSVFLEVYFCT